jgi:hypothetical protein
VLVKTLQNIFLKKVSKSGLPFFKGGINLHNNQKLKQKIMKFVKLSVLALSMGLFVASCGNSSSEATEAPATTETAPAAEATPAPEAAPAAPAADSANAAAPAAPAEAAPAAPAGH